MKKIGIVDAGRHEPSYRTVSQRYPQIESTHLQSDGALDQFDGVVVHTEIATRAQVVLRAAQSVKHILVASPIAETEEQARELVEACRKSGAMIMPGLSMRFEPSQVSIMRALSDGKLGDPGLLRIHLWQSSTVGGGGASEESVAASDLANWYFGSLPERVYAVEKSGYLQMHLGFNGGGMSIVDVVSSLPDGDSYESVSMIGSTGAAYADDHHNRNLLFAGGIPSAIITGQGEFQLLRQLLEFASSIEEERDPTVSGEDGIRALRVAEAARNSAASGNALKAAGETYERA